MQHYRLLAVDDNGAPCNVDLGQLIEHITKEVLKSVPNSHKLISTDGWIAKRELYFNHKKSITTNLGVYQKVNDTPAIISFIRFWDGVGHQVGRLIFVSPDRKGCIYRSPDGRQHPNPKQHGEMFYNITHEDIRLEDDSIASFSNTVFDSEEEAVKSLIMSSEVQTAQYFSIFPKEGDVLLALGSNFEDDVMNAPIIFDKEGNIWCNGVYNKDGKEVSSKC